MTVLWLGQSVGTLVRTDQDFSLMLELAFWSPFSLEGYLGQPKCSDMGLGPASK